MHLIRVYCLIIRIAVRGSSNVSRTRFSVWFFPNESFELFKIYPRIKVEITIRSIWVLLVSFGNIRARIIHQDINIHAVQQSKLRTNLRSDIPMNILLLTKFCSPNKFSNRLFSIFSLAQHAPIHIPKS